MATRAIVTRDDPPPLLDGCPLVFRLEAVLLGEGRLHRAQQERCQRVDLLAAEVEVGHAQALEVLAFLALVKYGRILELVLEEALVAVPALQLRLVGLQCEVEPLQRLAALDRQVRANTALFLEARDLVTAGTAIVADGVHAGGGHVRIVHVRRGRILVVRALLTEVGGDVARLGVGQAQAWHHRARPHRIGYVRVRGDFRGIVDPAHHVVVVHLFADPTQVCGEIPADAALAVSDGMAAKAAAGLEQFLAALGIPAGVPDQLAVQRVLPQVGRDLLDLLVQQPEHRHLRARAELVGILDPLRNPLLEILELDLLQARAELLDLLRKVGLFHLQVVDLGIEAGVGQPQFFGPRVVPLGSAAISGRVAQVEADAHLLGIGHAGCAQVAQLLAHSGQLFGFRVVPLEAMAAPAALVHVQVPAHVQRLAARSDDLLGVALLAARFDVLGEIHRPEPELVAPVALGHAARSPAVAVVARRAAERLGVVDVEQFRPRVTLKHRVDQIRASDLDGLANAEMAGLAAVYQVDIH